MKSELGSQQELFLQGIDLFGSQVLVPYLFGLAGQATRLMLLRTAQWRI
jgi:hypothetical protein